MAILMVTVVHAIDLFCLMWQPDNTINLVEMTFFPRDHCCIETILINF
jgi:hypothetical protein